MKFQPRIKINFKQFIAIIVILVSVATIPFIIAYIMNPESRNLKEIAQHASSSLEISGVTDDDTPFTFKVPIINNTLDLTLLKKNPQFLLLIGIALSIFTFLIGVTLLRNRKRKKLQDTL